jgi:hypothetical protein
MHELESLTLFVNTNLLPEMFNSCFVSLQPPVNFLNQSTLVVATDSTDGKLPNLMLTGIVREMPAKMAEVERRLEAGCQ